MAETIELEGATLNVHLLLAALVFGIPLIATSLIAGKNTMILSGIIGFCALIYFGIAYTIASPIIVKINQNIVVKSGFYLQAIPIKNIKKEQMKVVDLETEKQYLPDLRTNGIGLVVLNIGYFNLQNGNKAFVIQRSKKAVYVPTTGECNLLLSSSDPEQLLIRIRGMM
jgi:hypothetical protein